jgi:hypothetical protein
MEKNIIVVDEKDNIIGNKPRDIVGKENIIKNYYFKTFLTGIDLFACFL